MELSMKKLSILCGFLLLGLTACSDNDPAILEPPAPPTPPAPVEYSDIQIIHASPNAPKVNLILDGTTIAENVDYLQAIELTQIEAGSHTAEVKAILPDGTTIDAFDAVTADFTADTIYTVLAVNNLDSIEALVLTRPDVAVTSGSVRLQIVHASPDAPMVDVYATAPDADLSQAAPLVTAEFKDSLDATEVPAGDYQIRITVAGDSAAVVYDSGTLSLADQSDLVVAAVPNTGPGSQPVNLLVISPEGASLVVDKSTPAAVRVIHASPDAPAVDIVANDDFAAPLIPNLLFSEFVGYVNLPADDYNIKVVPTGVTTPVVIDADLSLAAGMAYNVIAANTLASIEALVVTADNRRVATEAKLRIIHASPTAQDVDIYLVEAGADITSMAATLSDIPFLADTNFLSVAEGNYDVIVTVAGSKDPAIGPAPVTLNANGIYTIIARDAEDGGGPLSVILLDDFEG
jgi:hypothetical protein